jgi:KUP system potassium uptake protein
MALALGSIGVVYGDIGTSPLYAFREALRPVAGDGITAEEITGIISLMLWALTVIVTLKYVDRKSTRLNSSHNSESRMPSSA